MTAPDSRRAASVLYFFLTYLLLSWLNLANIDWQLLHHNGFSGALFLINAYASYNFMYLLPALLLTWLASRPMWWRWTGKPALAAQAGIVTAIAAGTLTTLFFYANAKLHMLYGMYINGFVLNLVTTPGGLESMGGSDASNVGFALIAGGFLLLQVGLFVVSRLVVGITGWTPPQRRRLLATLTAVFLLSTVADRASYAYQNAFSDSEILSLSQGVPYYTGFTSRHFFRMLGFNISPQEKVVSIKGELNYPLHALNVSKPAKPYNIVWLVSESWRADTLTPDIMPATSAFAAKAQDFKLNYSGGNGTRIGVFSMMTGVPGSYWPVFLQSHRSAAMIDVLQQQDYQMSFYTSARFSYPEFDQSIFSKVPKDQLHWIDAPLAGWEKDRKNVGDMLQFIDQRDPTRPFFTFMFFESPHARYYFPPESVIRKPYRDDINYATMDRGTLKGDMTLIKNRYLNAVHHLDSQFQRVFDYLEAHQLLDSTIVVAVGDHGEEFMEHGYWGHNSTFSDQQTRTPLVLWMPGRKPAVHEELTSHLDLPATIMPRLGVTNPASDYSVGNDLLSDVHRDHVILSDWSSVGYKDSQVKIRLPMNAGGFASKQITGPHDEMLNIADAQSRFKVAQPELVGMMRELGKFSVRASARTQAKVASAPAQEQIP
ncbi:MAG TPA: sulfatase-like hydrolase/transferase [Methylophilaceae bacterium]|nr:sulfatase-like hydrolase/transferase [Methylophilaceae bacterium]